MHHVRVGSAPLDPSELMQRVAAPGAGAISVFVGTVRDHADGRSVTGMDYESYPAMAERVLTAIVQEAASGVAPERGPVRIAVEHRTGELAVGEASVVVAVAAAHREEAFVVCRQIIEAVKSRLPVWKREHYAEGDSRWLGDAPIHSTAGDVGSDG